MAIKGYCSANESSAPIGHGGSASSGSFTGAEGQLQGNWCPMRENE